MNDIRLLVTGGPGVGATSTGAALAGVLGIPHFDSDDYFHMQTDSPFRIQYSKEERHDRIREALDKTGSGILFGSRSETPRPIGR